jgi:hypothetical protein
VPLLLVVAAVGVAALLVALWWKGDGSGPKGPAPPPASWRASAAPRSADYTLRPAELVKIDQAALPAERALLVELVLAEPSTHAEPLPAQLRDTSGRALDLLAAVELDERSSARVEIEPGWLRAGSYLIELRTTERSHFPIRRYPFTVR